MKIIITGGAGFIASHIADAYIAAGHSVAIIDNLVTGFRKNVHPRARFYKADIRTLADMERIFKKERPEIVNHQAARVSVVESLENPIATFDTNVLGTANVLIAFGRYGRGTHKKFIFASTGGAIYGEPKKIPADERAPAAPLAPYGLSKELGERIVQFYAHMFGFPYFIFRSTNIYGPRQSPFGEAGVVAIFGRLMRRGVRPTIFGDGSKVRDYVYVDDVVRANILALRKGVNDTVNIGCGARVTDQDIFDTMAEAIHFTKTPRYAPFRKGEVNHITLDARKARRVLGWKPRVMLADGIRKTLLTIK